MSPELQNTKKMDNEPSQQQMSQGNMDSSSNLEVANPFKMTTQQSQINTQQHDNNFTIVQ